LLNCGLSGLKNALMVFFICFSFVYACSNQCSTSG
jgi:hypothetical protein